MYDLHEAMSRLLRPLTLALAGLALAVAGCRTSTPYTAMYSPRKSYFVAPTPKSEKSAEELLKATDTAPAPLGGAPAGGPPPPDAGAGLNAPPPPSAPAVDPLAAPAPAPAAN